MFIQIKITMNIKEDASIIEQLAKLQQDYITDSYSMSIGEFMSMYKDNELEINPKYQRAFRWSQEQQSRFIESIFLQIPLPSIFIFQDKKKWEVIDGLQRLSTIFRFTKILKSEEEESLTLKGLRRAVFLNGKSWDDFEDDDDLRFLFRKTKMDVKIIKDITEKPTNAKFELFQRLNHRPTLLSGQEYRNALLIMFNEDVFNWLDSLAKYPNFKNSIKLSDKKLKEQYDKELILRLFIFASYDLTTINKIDEFLDNALFYDENSLLDKIEDKTFSLELEKKKFQKTFDLLYEAKGEEVFKKTGDKQKFLTSYYEAIAIGLYFNIDSYSGDDITFISDKIQLLEDDNVMKQAAPSAGSNTEKRIKILTNYSKTHFAKQNNGQA